MTATTKSVESLSPMQQAVLDRLDSIGAWISGSTEKIGKVVSTVGDAAYKEAIDVAQQYVLYGRVIETTQIIMCILVIVATIWFVKKTLIKSKGRMTEPEILFSVFGCAIGVIASIISCIAFFVNLKSFVMVWFAPKIWLGIELVQMVRSVKGM